MTITTKLDIGDDVFYIENNNIKSMEIDTINVSVVRNQFHVSEIDVSYLGKSDQNKTRRVIHENKAYSTKEELLKTL